MTRLRAALARFVGTFLTWRREVELSDEIQAHLDLLTAEHLRRGLSLDEARAAARRDVGGIAQIKEMYREQYRWRPVDELTQDLRYAWRILRKDLGFMTVAVSGNASPFFSYDAYQVLRDGVRDVELACVWGGRNAMAEWGPLTFELVTGNYFQTIGVGALRGRMLAFDDDRPGDAHLIIWTGSAPNSGRWSTCRFHFRTSRRL